MTTFASALRLGWDTETTGPNPLEDRIVSAAVIARDGMHPDRVFPFLINPGVPIPAEATAVHGITDEMVQAEGRSPKDALDEIATHLAAAILFATPVVAFNTAFDWSILHYELLRNGLLTVVDRVGPAPYPFVDPHVIDKQCIERLRGKGMRKLKPTAERYRVKLDDWHTAEADALAALLIAEKQFERYPQLGSMDTGQLYAAQRTWRAEQQASLQQWFRTQATAEQGGAPDKVIDGSWPLVPYLPGGAA